MVSRISDKMFMGKDILYVGVWKKGDERMVFNGIYTDGKTGRSLVKRFNVLAVTRDKEYDLTKGNKGSKLIYLSGNPNGEAETVTVKLSPSSTARKKVFDFDFSTLEIKGRAAGSNILTRYPVRKIEIKSEGLSTLGGLELWYDDTVGKLNKEQRGKFIGTFNGDDKVLIFYKDGNYELTNYELTNRYEAIKIAFIERLDENKVISSIYYDGESKQYFVKRFKVETLTPNKKFIFISESNGSFVEYVSTADSAVVEVDVIKGKSKTKDVETLDLKEIIEVKGWKSIGNKLSQNIVKKIRIVKEIRDQGKEVKPRTKNAKSDPEKVVSTKRETKFTETKTPENKDTELEKDRKPPKQGNKEQSNKKGKDDSFGVGSTIELDF